MEKSFLCDYKGVKRHNMKNHTANSLCAGFSHLSFYPSEDVEFTILLDNGRPWSNNIFRLS